MLLASAIYPLQEGERLHLQGCCRPSIDWAAFLALAARHHLIPTVYRNLSVSCAALVSAPFLSQLKEQAELHRQRSLQLLAQLARLSRAFTQAGVPLCTLKGPLLAQRLFGDASLRSSGDLDLLVTPQALAQADSLLLSLGCQRTFPAAPLTPRQWQVFQSEWYNYTYFLPGAQIYIELHWTIASPDLVPPAAVQAMLARLAPLTPAGGGPLTLSEQDLPVYLLAHGAKHNWVRLKWLVDFAAWTRTANSQDWQALQAGLQALGLERILGQALFLCRWLFAAPAPQQVLPSFFDPLALRLARRSLAAILNPSYRGLEAGQLQRLSHALYLMQLKKGAGYQWAVLSKVWIIPYDWQDVPLPDALFPLYGLLRPFLWLRRHYFGPHRPQPSERRTEL